MRGTVIVRGGGDLATGIIYRLWRADFSVLCLEIERPLVVRLPVSAASAVFDGRHEVEGMPCVLVDSPGKTPRGAVGVMIDPDGKCIPRVSPQILVDAIMAKRNTGTKLGMAPLVLAIGPGFHAPSEVHGVIETKRGHYLGRLITNGGAAPDTGIPGVEMGYSAERLLRAPTDGYAEHARSIGDHVEPGDVITRVAGIEVRSEIPGVLRGLIHPSVYLSRGIKIGDTDPRDERKNCFAITDKSLSVAGGVLEAVMRFEAAGSL
ncbi:MAG: EF2563 family selenium-dependent molybdenum hydroxylase system protein [Synergistaceae bacterium]|nr:EF2563 family selenium-dependent molybdenum hydroxylase system protein [Synergistaceae bacterium]